MRTLLYTLFFGLFLTSCQSDNEEEKYNNDKPNTEIMYSQQIQPIIQTNCMVCHNAQAGQGGLVIVGESTIVSLAQSGVLEQVLLLPSTSPRKMPPGFDLPRAELDLLLAWIEQVNE
jgi:uncharacterized membrane protein